MTVRRRKILFVGFLACMGEEYLPRRVISGEMVGGKGYSLGRERHWMGRHGKDSEKVRRHIRRLSRDSIEGRQRVPRGRGRSRGFHAETACCGDGMLRRWHTVEIYGILWGRALQKCDTDRGNQRPPGGGRDSDVGDVRGGRSTRIRVD